MNTLVRSIFATKNLAISIATYLDLIENVDKKVDKLISKEFNSAIQMLEQARYISNQAVYSNMLVGIIDRFNQAIALEKRERLLLSHLGLMMCYYYLGERNAFLIAQQKVTKLEFDTTFWEKYGGTIKNGGVVLLGVAMALLSGGRVSPGAGGAMGAQSGRKIDEEHSEMIISRQNKFENLKNAITALRWQ